MESSSNPTFFMRMEGRRIVYYRSGGRPQKEAFWSDHWAGISADTRFYAPYERGFLGPYRKLFSEYLPKDGRILEAGCGLAQYVIALRQRGFDCVGLDSAETTILQVLKTYPELPVSVGDVCNLPFSDGELGGYISLGVVEHFKEGPEKPLIEAKRVLAAGGVGIIAVPVSTEWRTNAVADSDEDSLPPDAEFYQYAFPPDEFERVLKDIGFVVTRRYGFGTHYALRSRSRIFRRALKLVPQLRSIDRVLDGTQIAQRYGRTQAWVVQKPDQAR